MKIAIFSTKSYDKYFLEKFNPTSGYELTFFDSDLNPAFVPEGFTVVCVFVNDKLDKTLLELMAQKGIKLIALRSAGFNNVDIEAAAKLGIKVFRVPAYSPQAIAEHAVALIMSLNRKIHEANARVSKNNFSIEGLVGFNLHEKTVGVIGTGKIGTAFCKIMKGFGCQVIAYDIAESEEVKNIGIEYKSFNDLLKFSDIISLHCPLNAQTKYLMNGEAFSKMKKGVMLINTSRGGILNTMEAIEVLKNKQIGYLGLDVYENESPLFFNDLSHTKITDQLFLELKSFPNVLITSHQSFLTSEALQQIAQTTFKNIADFEKGLPSDNEVK